jgi:DNA-binding YbaB/EbfC family protein
MDVKLLQQLFTQFRQFQETLQRQIEGLFVEASAGGGMVVVKMNGQKEVVEVRIDPELLQSRDVEMLQEMIRSAVNEASRRVDEEIANQMRNAAGGLAGVTGLLKIPGLF